MLFVRRRRHSSCNISSATRLLRPNFIPRDFDVTAHGSRYVDRVSTAARRASFTLMKRSKTKNRLPTVGITAGIRSLFRVTPRRLRLSRVHKKSAMINKNLSLAFTAAGIGCGTLLVHANFFGAYAQNTTEVCGVECVLKRIDALNQKVGALEHSVDGLTIEMENSIKSGRGITLHTDSKSSWRVPHLYWSEGRFGRLRFLECKLLSRYIVDYQSNDATDIKDRLALTVFDVAAPDADSSPTVAARFLHSTQSPAVGRAPDGRTWILWIALDVRTARWIGKDGRCRACKQQQNQNGFFSCHARISPSARSYARASKDPAVQRFIPN